MDSDFSTTEFAVGAADNSTEQAVWFQSFEDEKMSSHLFKLDLHLLT